MKISYLNVHFFISANFTSMIACKNIIVLFYLVKINVLTNSFWTEIQLPVVIESFISWYPLDHDDLPPQLINSYKYRIRPESKVMWGE